MSDTVTKRGASVDAAADANSERIHPSRGDRRPREKDRRITGCDRPPAAIEMWVMRRKEQKFVYAGKEGAGMR